MKCQFIARQQKNFALQPLLQSLNIKKTTYDAWKRRGNCARLTQDEELKQEIEKLYQDSKGTYGAPRIQVALAKLGHQVSRRRIHRLMAEKGLKVRHKRKFRVTTRSKADHRVSENLLDRQFHATGLNQKWTTDITYLPTFEGWLYLAVVLDVFSRKVVGWAFDTRLETDLALSALRMAVSRRKPEMGLLHHSDRGCQYTSQEYQTALSALQATCSMSRKGNCWDNAVTESFFATLKMELGLERPLGDRAATQRAVFHWMEAWYNRVRLHSALQYHSPMEFEARHCG